MFGIAWGVFSLLLLVGLGEGFRSGNRKQFDSLGENVMFIFGGRAPAVQGSFTGMRQYYLTYQDYLDIKNECPDVQDATPIISRGDIRAVSEFFQSSGQLMGVEANFGNLRYMPIADGRWLNDLDNSQKREVVVLGDEARRLLFPGRPSGKQHPAQWRPIRGGRILQRIGRGDNNTLNLRIFIPFETMRQYFPPINVGETIDPISFINYRPVPRPSRACQA